MCYREARRSRAPTIRRRALWHRRLTCRFRLTFVRIRGCCQTNAFSSDHHLTRCSAPLAPLIAAMGAYYDEIEIEDMTWDEAKGVFHYPCPCGDRFEITRKQLKNYEDIATCPSCSLIIRVIFDPVCISLSQRTSTRLIKCQAGLRGRSR